MREEFFYQEHCLHMLEQPIFNNGEINPKFKLILQQMKDEKKNAIYALEYARLFFDGFAKLTDMINIRIVVTYRRLYEWLPSAYNENLKNHDGLAAPSPYDFDLYDIQMRNFLHQTRFVINEADRLIGVGNYALDVIDMHAKHDVVKKGDDLLVELFCTGAVPNAINTCRAAKNNELVQGNVESNTRLEVHFQALAFKAHQLGILKQKPNTDQLYQLKECLSKDKGALWGLPKVCMSEDHLEKLYQLSWEEEQKFFPERSEDSHRVGFEEYKKQGKFCSLDVDEWLASETWQGKISACGEYFFDEGGENIQQ